MKRFLLVLFCLFVSPLQAQTVDLLAPNTSDEWEEAYDFAAECASKIDGIWDDMTYGQEPSWRMPYNVTLLGLYDEAVGMMQSASGQLTSNDNFGANILLMRSSNDYDSVAFDYGISVIWETHWYAGRLRPSATDLATFTTDSDTTDLLAAKTELTDYHEYNSMAVSGWLDLLEDCEHCPISTSQQDRTALLNSLAAQKIIARATLGSYLTRLQTYRTKCAAFKATHTTWVNTFDTYDSHLESVAGYLYSIGYDYIP